MKIIEIKKKILSMICEFNPMIDSVDLEENYSLIDDFGFDSLMLINFISDLEAEFEILFDIDDDLNMLVNDINKLSAFIYEKRGRK